MGLFRRKRASSASPGNVERGACSCPEHLEGVIGLAVPLTAEVLRESPDEQAMTVGELIEADALGVEPCEMVFFHDVETGALDDGPYNWTVWVGDEARSSYDDEAELALDRALRAQPGVERVLWEDREVLHVGAPTVCVDGMLATVARALLDPRVRMGEHS
jgi:hypothetical protein